MTIWTQKLGKRVTTEPEPGRTSNNYKQVKVKTEHYAKAFMQIYNFLPDTVLTERSAMGHLCMLLIVIGESLCA